MSVRSSDESLRRVHALVRQKEQQPWERTWIVVHAKSLTHAIDVAGADPDVVSVHEVCYDPGYAT